MSEVEQELPATLDEQISLELIKHNYTEEKLKEFEEYLKLDIVDDNKESYLLIKDKRKEVKAYRVATEKFCKFKREDAVKVQKAWVAKENELSDRMGKVEDYLEGKEKAYEKKIAEEKEVRKRKHEEQLIMRQQVLAGMGVLYSGGAFILGEVAFDLSLVKESEPDIWEETILPKFKAEYEKVEAERIEQERIKKEREAELMRQELEMERKRKELEEKEAALKKAEEERLKKERDEQLRKEAEEADRINRLWRGRLRELGCRWDGHQAYARRDDTVVVATYNDLVDWTDEQFKVALEDYRSAEAEHAEYLEQKRLAEIEAQKEAERKRILGDSRMKALKDLGRVPKDATRITLSDLSEEEYDALYANEKREYEASKRAQWLAEQEEKRKQEELLEQQRIDQAKDKEKWSEIMRRINEIEVYDMKSSQYRKKAMILREKLEEIKAL